MLLILLNKLASFLFFSIFLISRLIFRAHITFGDLSRFALSPHLRPSGRLPLCEHLFRLALVRQKVKRNRQRNRWRWKWMGNKLIFKFEKKSTCLWSPEPAAKQRDDSGTEEE